MAIEQSTSERTSGNLDGTVTTEAQPIIDVRHLTKHFPVGGFVSKQAVHALEDVSFSIPQGEVVALVGESGSGKSTTARLLARLIAPTSGEIVYEGKDILITQPRGASLSYRSEVQMVFQDPFGSLNPVHPIRYHLERPLKIHKKTRGRRELRERMHELLETVGLEPPDEVAAKYPYQLSGGQRQRVAFARALAVEPKVMLADEPVSMLDVSVRAGILDLLAGLRRSGLGILMITHDLSTAAHYADRIAVMYLGRIVELGPAVDVVRNPQHPYTRALISVVPSRDPLARARPQLLEGETPNPTDIPPGCRFAPRCPMVEERCKSIDPELRPVGEAHEAACILVGAPSPS